MEPVPVYLVRHAESKWNCAGPEERKAAGATLRDADLSAAGRAQLENIAQVLPSELRTVGPTMRIYCSPLTRAIRTALAISAVVGSSAVGGSEVVGAPEVMVLPYLREIRTDIGDVGSPPADLIAAFGSRVRGLDLLGAKWWLQGACACPPTAECETCTTSRLKSIQRLLEITQDDPIMIVTHSDIIAKIADIQAPTATVYRTRRA